MIEISELLVTGLSPITTRFARPYNDPFPVFDAIALRGRILDDVAEVRLRSENEVFGVLSRRPNVMIAEFDESRDWLNVWGGGELLGRAQQDTVATVLSMVLDNYKIRDLGRFVSRIHEKNYKEGVERSTLVLQSPDHPYLRFIRKDTAQLGFIERPYRSVWEAVDVRPRDLKSSARYLLRLANPYP